jgi:c-di-GMP-binding flagellar brake protein YcgR
VEEPEIIAEEQIPVLFGRLKRERTILKLYIPGINNDWLSIVIGIEAHNGLPCFVIDFPGGAGHDLWNSQGKRAIIEFTDRNRVHCRLKSVIEKIEDQNIYMLMPETVYRLQRRGFFRVPSPINTRVIIRDEDGSLDLDVVNIGEGGVLVSNPTSSHRSVRFFRGAFKGLSIVYKENEAQERIEIKKAEIRRVVKRPETGCYEYAFMFRDRGKDIEKEIRKFIYSCQRKMLYRMKYPEDQDQI